MFSAEVAIYPENNTNGDVIVNNSIQSLNNSGIKINVDHMATRISGSAEEVWSALKTMSKRAENNGEFSMVVTITNH